MPTCPEFVAPTEWRRIDFISDLHLQESMPRTLEAFASHLRHTPADAICLLGDIFEVWVGDDARTGPFEQACLHALRECARTRWVGFMAGNRDFLVGTEFLGAAGLHELADPMILQAFGQRTLLTHGDAWCLDDVDYQRFRQQVRAPDWQKAFLARPLTERRAIARQMREASEARAMQMTQAANHPGSGYTETWADVDMSTAAQWLRDNRAATLVHGHTHRPGDEPIGPGLQRLVLTDWDLDHDPTMPRAEILSWSTAGFERLPPSRA